MAVDSVFHGVTQWYYSRFSDNGQYDVHFHRQGFISELTGAAAALAVQPNGDILVAGQAATDAFFARYASSGVAVTVSEPDVAPTGLSLTFNGTAITGTGPIAYSGADTQGGGSLSGAEIEGSFTDPGSAQEPHLVTIVWGDGSPNSTLDLDAGQTTFSYPLPQYAVSGSYTVTVTVADADGTNPTTSSFAVDYTNSQPSGLTLSLDNSTISAGDQVTLSGSFTDPDPNFAHLVTINWGDLTDPPDVTTLSLARGRRRSRRTRRPTRTPGLTRFP